jgi:hypothetical protein
MSRDVLTFTARYRESVRCFNAYTYASLVSCRCIRAQDHQQFYAQGFALSDDKSTIATFVPARMRLVRCHLAGVARLPASQHGTTLHE